MGVTGAIVGCGMSTPLGLDARQTALMLRARKLAPARTEHRDRFGLPIGDVRARRLDDALTGRGRLLALAAPALREAIRAAAQSGGLGSAAGGGLGSAAGGGLGSAAGAGAGGPAASGIAAGVGGVAWEMVPLFLSVPPKRASTEVSLGPDFLGDLERAAGVRLALEASEAIALGHAGFAAALSHALAFVAARAPRGPRDRRPLAIVGGVDSYHDPAVLHAIDEARRLHGGGAKDGFIPSEGAAFVVVTGADAPGASARVTTVVTGMERDDGPHLADDPPIAEALTDVVRAAASAIGAPVPWVLCDVNGEQHRVKEWTFARIRNREAFDDERTVETRPYDEMGDVGAATGAVYTSFVCSAFTMGFAPAPRALVVLSSDAGARGAFTLDAR